MRRAMRGFTLVELVMVMLLLGVMATFTSQFIGIGTEIYGDASSREQLMSDARFAMERLNREVRDAVPGSLRIENAGDISYLDQGNCLRFWPINVSSRYLAFNQPVSGGAGLQLPLAPLDAGEQVVSGAHAIVYPVAATALNNQTTLDLGCVGGRCVNELTDVTGSSSAPFVHYEQAFAVESPAQRVYFALEQVSYCISAQGALERRSGPIAPTQPADRTALMAEHIQAADSYFYREQGGFKSQAEVGLKLVFSRNDETVTFNHKLEVLNAP